MKNVVIVNKVVMSEKEDILKLYFYPHDSNIFVIKNLPEVIKGTLFSRYSRTTKDVKQLFLDEFYNNDELQGVFRVGVESKKLLTSKAEDFYERVLVGYGDDSVAELGGAHIAIEQISMLATKAIEEHRIGLSPLEKSTRYVYYDKKVDGKYRYYCDPVLMNSQFKDLYIQTCELLFDAYSKIVREAQPLLMRIFIGDKDDKAYTASIRAKACDLARSLLPLSAFTNMGVFGNGRAFEYLLTEMLGDRLDEVRSVGEQMHAALSDVIGPFIKRSKTARGDQYRTYRAKLLEVVESMVPERSDLRQIYYNSPSVRLVDFDDKAVEKILAAIVYQSCELDYDSAFRVVMSMSPSKREDVFKRMGGLRKYRQHKPLRAAEEPYAAFEIVADWGVYKDLMRHRILTRHKKLFSASYGYFVPPELEMIGLKNVFVEAMDKATQAYELVCKQYPEQAQYLVTHGSYTPFYVKINMRALSHLVELRSAPQGHSSYRFVAQEMARLICEQYPIFADSLFKFVDYKNYDLERLEAFKKLELKAKEKGVMVFED